MQYFKQFHQNLVNRDYSSFLSLWDEYCSGDELDEDEMIKVLEDVKASEFCDSFGRYVDKALPLWKTLGENPKAHAIFKLIIDLQTSNEEDLGIMTYEYVKKKFEKANNFEHMLKLVGLRNMRNFQGSVSNMELLCHMHKGNFVFHTGGWGVGEIMDISFLREQMSLEFDYVSGRKDLSFQNAFKNLLPISKEHFLARRFGDPDGLETFARENPTEVIKTLLKDLGPRSAAEIKEELSELVIPSGEWTKWWQSTRSKIKKDTSIEVPTNLRDPFKLRDVEIGHEERLQRALDKKPDLNALIQLVYSFLRDFPTTLKNEDFKASLQGKLTEALSLENLTDAQELQLRFFLEDLSPQKDHKEIEQIIKNFSSIDSVINNILVIAFKKRSLVQVRKIREDWMNVFFDLLWKVDQNPLRDYLFTELLAAGKEEDVMTKLQTLLEHPGRYPQSLLWYFKKLMSKAKIPMADQKGKSKFFEAFLILLSILDRSGPSNRDVVKKMLSFITNGRYAIVRKIFQNASIEEVQEFLLLATKCHCFTDHDIKIFHSLGEVVHPSLSKMRKKYSAEEEEEEVIWTTEKGLQKVKSRIEEIATVETVENAKEIEVARALGDLRENAEFKSALERRDRLQGELKSLSELVNKAQVILKENISTETVGIGVVVECEDPKGSSTAYTLLGPWDANTDENILSFQSKLAQDITGLKVGDSFKVHNTEYKIKKLKNYFV
ncbi:transcript cleavage factor [Candidatus Aerophobetes bacterium]|uniref:Transcription elongation factor GreA n=1 Tax=Aerophobetes bacterium TaxID=2030807 RepID=A0A2A4YJ31_UNCAE|nr:MAG: transcript cleavage factor [Candidatus Aerophobetes bacterium]